MNPHRLGWSSLLLALLACAANAAEPASVSQSARQIPVAYDVDVVVVGGSTGAVAAAVAAAEKGATVFLAAPNPYLGDDMTATLRLWLEPGEEPASPLARKLFADAPAPVELLNPIAFEYTADVRSDGKHRDTDPPSKLCDGRWANAPTESVQYNSDVNIVCTLKAPREIEDVRVMAFRRAGEGGYDVQTIAVATSDDGKTFRPVGAMGRQDGSDEFLTFTLPLKAKTRFVRLEVKRGEGHERLLLGEIVLSAPAPTAPPPDQAALRPAPRPMHVKKTLDDALLAAGVKYLYSCYATDVLRDAAGEPAGIVMANRAGRQAVRAKTIIDATDRATVARLAGAGFRPYPAGPHTFKRVVIGGEVQKGEGLSARIAAAPFRGPFPNKAKTASGEFQVIEYTLQLPMADDSFASWAAAEQKARTLTYHAEQQFTADELFELPPDAMQGRSSVDGPWPGADKLPLAALQPAGAAHVYVLGGCADVSRAAAEKLLRPLAQTDLGARVGTEAAADAKLRPGLAGVKLPGRPAADPAPGEVREPLVGVRPTQKLPTVPQEAGGLPVLGSYDVVVVGGGTGGAPAGISAARQGAKTLVIEYLHGLGGVGTLGAISTYYWGNRVGFTATIPGGASWVIEQRMEWWRTQILEPGGHIWFGALACGALVEGDRVAGVIVATPFGRGVVLAKAVIDATGNSDVAAAAGAATTYTDQTEFGMQGTGLPGRALGQTYNNTDFTIVDETDMVDVWQMFVFSKHKYPGAFDHGRLIDTRERRRIVGDTTITLLDQVTGRTYPDSVVQARSNFDTHGYTIDPLLLVDHPEHKGFNVYIPYRAMLPKGMEGVLVIGLGTSAHRDAVPLIRMQPDIQNQGYAAGVAATMAVKDRKPLRGIDLRALQQHLVEVGNLPESVLEDKDSFPLPTEKIAEAVQSLPEGKGAAVILAQPQDALPLLRDAYAATQKDDARLVYARMLAVLGDGAGLKTLTAEAKKAEQWDKGWNYRGMGQFGSAFSPLDGLLVALARTRDRRALPPVLEKLALLDDKAEFSHHRAVGLACELIGDPAAAKPLAELLAKPGMTGYAHHTVQDAIDRGAPGGTNAEQTRRESLRELMLARALFRCGDHQGVGRKILEAYAQDLRGHLARHAQAVLDEGAKKGK